MYRLIFLAVIFSLLQRSGEIYILFSEQETNEEFTLKKISEGSQSSFIFEYKNRTEMFISLGNPVKLDHDSFINLKLDTPEKLRKMESDSINKNIEESERKGSLKVLLSINDLFENIYIIEKISDNKYLKYNVYWND